MEGGRPINSYRDLDVWQDAMTLAESCYAFTKPFPREEAFGITSQIRRSAVSVAANIAEGHGRESTAAFIQFLRIAQGSLKELETHVLLAGRVGLAPMDTSTVIVGRCEALGRQLRGLIRALQRRAINEKGAR
ncbi:four helix bundle protein [Methylobacterium trifolii]|nr:four helix bundle protein [Methylobacterium trifolii]